MEWIKTIIYGIVEGITEWLPISSTGHMILLEKIMPMKVSSDFWEMYLVVIQLGAILAVVLMFWNQLWPFCSKEKGYIKKDTFSMWFKIIVACVPAAVVELVWGDQLEAAFYHYQVVALMLILVGIVFLIVERWNKERDAKVTTIAQITYRAAFINIINNAATIYSTPAALMALLYFPDVRSASRLLTRANALNADEIILCCLYLCSSGIAGDTADPSSPDTVTLDLPSADSVLPVTSADLENFDSEASDSHASDISSCSSVFP